MQAFVVDVGSELGRPLLEVPFLKCDTPSHVAAATGHGVDAVPETVEQMKSAGFQARKNGFTVDTYVVKKTGGDGVYKIIEVDDNAVVLVEQVDGRNAEEEVNVKTELCMTEWRVHKGKVMQPLAGWSLDNRCCPLQSATWGLERAKCAISIAAVAAYAKHKAHVQHFEFMQHPSVVRVTCVFGPGELILAPASQRVERKQSPDSLDFGQFDLADGQMSHLHMFPQFSPPLKADGTTNPNAWVVPFWFVWCSNREGDVNMKVTHISEKVGDMVIKVPVLLNIKELRPGDELMIAARVSAPAPAPPAAKAPVAKATIAKASVAKAHVAKATAKKQRK